MENESESDSAPECSSPDNSNEGGVVPSNSRQMRNLAEKSRRDRINSYITELARIVPLVANSPRRVDKIGVLRHTTSYLRGRLFNKTLRQMEQNGSLQNDSCLCPAVFSTTNIISNNVTSNSRLDETRSNAESSSTSDIVCRSTTGSRQGHNYTNALGFSRHDKMLESMTSLMCDQMGGFMMALSADGKIVNVSQKVENILGHYYADLLGLSIYNITCPDDHKRIQHQLAHDLTVMSDGTGGERRRNFNIRMARAHTQRNEPIVYDQVNISGYILECGYLICIVKLLKPPQLVDMMLEATKNEYITRHLVDGRIVMCDQRISVIAGYMSEEVTGLSAFNFMHKEDVRWTMIGLRHMYDRGESRGSSCYRLLSRSNQFIYLRTCGYLEVDETGHVESFVCVNTLVTEKEGKLLIEEMKKRYSALIKPAVEKRRGKLHGPDSTSCLSPSNSLASHSSEISGCLENLSSPVDTYSMDSSDGSEKSFIERLVETEDRTSEVESVEDPKLVEEAVMHLIGNLPGSPVQLVTSPNKKDYLAISKKSLKLDADVEPTSKKQRLDVEESTQLKTTNLGSNGQFTVLTNATIVKERCSVKIKNTINNILKSTNNKNSNVSGSDNTRSASSCVPNTFSTSLKRTVSPQNSRNAGNISQSCKPFLDNPLVAATSSRLEAQITSQEPLSQNNRNFDNECKVIPNTSLRYVSNDDGTQGNNVAAYADAVQAIDRVMDKFANDSAIVGVSRVYNSLGEENETKHNSMLNETVHDVGSVDNLPDLDLLNDSYYQTTVDENVNDFSEQTIL